MTPRAILLDLILPGMQGEEFLARAVSGAGKPLPVVVLTVKDLGPEEISALESAGALAVLPKGAGAPQAAVELIADDSRANAGRLMRAQTPPRCGSSGPW